MIEHLPLEWMSTRATLQAYAQALTAFPRAATPVDPRWAHVAMKPVEDGFTAAAIELANGSMLVSRMDLINHRIVIEADGYERIHDMALGPAPWSIGQEILELAASRGSRIDVDRARFDDTADRTYDPGLAEAFHRASKAAITAMVDLNTGLDGEVTGPHLWPHGFDIATEWYSPMLVDHGGGKANAQIAAGWYPSDASYVYVNPWPFSPEWADVGLPHGARWHLEGWHGAELAVPEGGLPPTVLTDLALTVHDLAATSLGG